MGPKVVDEEWRDCKETTGFLIGDAAHELKGEAGQTSETHQESSRKNALEATSPAVQPLTCCQQRSGSTWDCCTARDWEGGLPPLPWHFWASALLPFGSGPQGGQGGGNPHHKGVGRAGTNPPPTWFLGPCFGKALWGGVDSPPPCLGVRLQFFEPQNRPKARIEVLWGHFCQKCEKFPS